MKKLLFLTLLSFCCFSCSDRYSEFSPAQIVVNISNECVCNVFLYTPGGLCLQSKIWDCQETKVLIFNVIYSGELIIKAELREKSASESITIQYGKTYEVGITL